MSYFHETLYLWAEFRKIVTCQIFMKIRPV